MDQYTLTKSRTIQWIIITLVLVGMTGAHWYFQTRAAVTMKTANKTGLVGYWNFDEGTGTTAYDKSGQNNTATLTSGPTWVDGKSGKAVNFDGVNDYVNAGTGASLNLTGTMTIAAWIYPTNFSSGGGRGRIVDKGSILFILDSSNVTNGLSFSTNGADVSVSAANIVVQNKWQHVVVTYGGGGTSPSFFVDGVFKGTAAVAPGAPSSNSNPYYIGNSAANTRQFSGTIDEVRVYNRALSATEIANLYALGTATVNASTNALDTNGLVGQWSFDGKNTAWTSSVAGTTADTSGNGNTGTLTNMSQVTSPVPGKIGQAFNFFPNGTDTNSYANMGDPASGILDFGTADFSVGFWMKGAGYSAQGSSANVPVAKRSFNSTEKGYGFSYGSGNTLSFIIYNGTTGYAATDTVATTNDNLWHHYVGVRSAGTMYLYRDGAVRGTNATVSGDISTSYSLVVGGDSALAGDRNAKAIIDEVRVYNRALSATEIANLYALGTATVNASTNALDTNGLVGQWSFDGKNTAWTSSVAGTTADTSGNGNTGTLTNMSQVTSPVPGKIGQAFNFDGVNDYILVPTENGFNDKTNGTISTWFKLTNTSATQFLWRSGQTSSDSPSVYASGGTLYYHNNAAEVTIATTASLVGQWHHVIVTWTASGRTAYLDGVSKGTGGVPTRWATGFHFGSDNNNASPWNGAIDDIRVFDHALSAAEVTALYNAGR